MIGDRRAYLRFQQSIYRPRSFHFPTVCGAIRRSLVSGQEAEETYGNNLEEVVRSDRFVPARGFQGAEPVAGAAPRAAPVEFEQEQPDIFGIGELFQTRRSDKEGGGARDSGARDSSARDSSARESSNKRRSDTDGGASFTKRSRR